MTIWAGPLFYALIFFDFIPYSSYKYETIYIKQVLSGKEFSDSPMYYDSKQKSRWFWQRKSLDDAAQILIQKARESLKEKQALNEKTRKLIEKLFPGSEEINHINSYALAFDSLA
jgi:hypothetical protein